MAIYKVQQRAEIWYETEVEADSPEQARDKAWADDVLQGWEQLPDTTEFQDEFYIKNEEDDTDDWEEFK
jgi:hypothetical protein